MAYEYYCLKCGKTLSQETVLFDMQRLLIEDENSSFNTLRFRLTHNELKNLIASGTPAEDNYRTCSLSLSQIMSYIGNSNNLDDSRIAGLTLEQIEKYTTPVAAATTLTTVKSSIDWDDEEDEEDAVVEEQVEEIPEPLKALEAKVTAMVGDALAADLLKRDLEYLKNAFYKGNYVLKLKAQMEPYENTKELMVGFDIQYPISKRNASIPCRICPKCGEPVPRESGTARHRSVVFIGNPSSGKTSAILALTHYAENYMVYGLSSEIWGHSKRIDAVKTIKLIEPKEELKKHKKDYVLGIAPERTRDSNRNDAYSATFLIKTGSRTTMLTLTDLPGEVCNKGGSNKVNENKVRNDFQVALACDAFVLCFDTEAVRGDSGKEDSMTPGEIIGSVCDQANTFQKLRKEKSGKDFIPTMVLFTKCRELEKENLVRSQNTATLRPLERIYMFREEKRIIDGNGIYQAVCNAFNDSHQLARAYHAMLRCSPFGYGAPTHEDIEMHGKVPETPTPRNIDQLMHWLLMVSGCVPAEAFFCPNITGEGGGLRLDNFYIDRVQCRSERPIDDWNNLMSGWNHREALARWMLFENPGFQDKIIMEDYGQSRAVAAGHKVFHAKARNDK